MLLINMDELERKPPQGCAPPRNSDSIALHSLAGQVAVRQGWRRRDSKKAPTTELGPQMRKNPSFPDARLDFLELAFSRRRLADPHHRPADAPQT